MTNSVALTDYINSDSNLEVENQKADEKIIAEIQNITESVESESDNIIFDYKEFVFPKSAVQSQNKLHDYFEEHNIDCKY